MFYHFHNIFNNQILLYHFIISYFHYKANIPYIFQNLIQSYILSTFTFIIIN